MASRSLNPDEQALMLAQLRSLRDKLLFLTGLYTGFRIHELLAIRVRDVWRAGAPAHELTVSRRYLKGGVGRRSKQLMSRTVPLTDGLRAAIQTFIQQQYKGRTPPPEDFLFRSRERVNRSTRSRTLVNRPICPEQAFRILQSAARRAGLGDRVSTHSMRKTFALSIYDISKHDIIETSQALGHRSIATTEHYLKSARNRTAAFVRLIQGPAFSIVDGVNTELANAVESAQAKEAG